MTHRISATPDPVADGEQTSICYDFSDGATSPVTLTLNYDPPTPSEQITLSSDEPCKTVTVPANATGLIIEDQSGQSEDRAVTVT